MKVTILGCGASGGVPLVGCKCAVCTSKNPRNHRSRTSIMLEVKNTTLLIDSSPDLRHQLLKTNYHSADAVLYTHDHADHTHGIDDLRAFNYHRNAPLPIYGQPSFLQGFNERFSYAFTQKRPEVGWHRPYLAAHPIDNYGKFSIGDAEIQSFLQYHGKGETLGYRIGNFAYSTDVNNLPENSLQALESLDVWVVDCLRRDPAPTHAHLDLALSWIESVRPKRAYLTHMSHDLDYDWLLSILPTGVEPAYDGLTIHLPEQVY